MKPVPSTRFSLDLDFLLGRPLLHGGALGEFARCFVATWPSDNLLFEVWDSPNAGCKVDLGVSGALVAAIKSDMASSTSSPFYRALVQKFQLPGGARRCGGMEVRSPGGSVGIIINVDDLTFPRTGSLVRYGNTITIQIRAGKIYRRDSVEWAGVLFKRLCSKMRPWYARANVTAEFDFKNMHCGPDGTWAIGVNFSKALPGLYWMNFFGKPYVELLGRARLLEAPAYSVEALSGRRVLLLLGERPEEWDTQLYLERERQVLSHLGETFFFDRHFPDRRTVTIAQAREAGEKCASSSN